MTTFAEELTAVRKERHITQEQLANEMNVSRSSISHWENGRVIPDLDTIKHLSQVLDHNFLTAESPTDTAPMEEVSADAAPTAEVPAEEASAAPEVPAARKPRRAWRYAVGGGPVKFFL